MTTGMMVRTSVRMPRCDLPHVILIPSQLTGTIFRKALRLSGRARADHSIGQITTMISSDAARLDQSAAFFHK
jgi:hypothetical protein